MSSLLTNTSAMTALQTLRASQSNLQETQARISTGLKIRSGKDNAAYFAISKTMSSDSSIYKSINDGLTLTHNAIDTARVGTESTVSLVQNFASRVAFAQNQGVDLSQVKNELSGILDQVKTTISQSTFNGTNLVSASKNITVVTGISRAGAAISTTTTTFASVDLKSISNSLSTVISTWSVNMTAGALASQLSTVNTQLGKATSSATALGVSEKSVESQQTFLKSLTDNIDSGVGAMVDANMEEESARLQAQQTQQQLATQALSIANQQSQSIMSLFR
jgi:flagellin